jgi:outer membrane protein assembly factor BamB
MINHHKKHSFSPVRNPLLLLGVHSSLLIAAVGATRLYAADFGRAMTTVQYDNAHTGWNQDETTLAPENVNPATFGKKWQVPLDGSIKAAPLYVSGVVINGQARDVVYVATARNLIYALDANTGESVWERPYFLDTPGLPENLQQVPCGDIGPVIGIVSTPVIELNQPKGSGTLYALGLTCQDTPCVLGSTQAFQMTAVDITTGESIAGWPVLISPDANIPIDTTVTSARGALLLANDKVYAPFGGYCFDFGSYHGWVVGVDKTAPTAQVAYRTPGTTSHRGSGIWASGGIAGDETGNIYPSTGNSFAAPGLDYSNAVLRLASDLSFSESPSDFFIPSNWEDLNRTDSDLGSSTPLLLPRQEESRTPNMIFVTGKKGVGHLIDRDNLGGVATGDGEIGEGIYSTKVFDSAFTTAAYYQDPDNGPFIFLAGRGTQPNCGTSSGVAALALDLDSEGNSSYHIAWCTPSMTTAMSPVVTSSPGQTGILWVVARQGGLFAFNAATGELLYSSESVAGDELGSTPNFLHFTVIDGRVFVANAADNLVSYGLR